MSQGAGRLSPPDFSNKAWSDVRAGILSELKDEYAAKDLGSNADEINRKICDLIRASSDLSANGCSDPTVLVLNPKEQLYRGTSAATELAVKRTVDNAVRAFRQDHEAQERGKSPVEEEYLYMAPPSRRQRS
ncbi:hypothetical protein XPA_010508 [Xanthoria parietina]